MKTTLLQSSDITGITFWLISMALLASTFFFFIERNSVKASWRTSMTLSGLVTGIAFVHYMYMREVWVSTGTSPTVFRYIDWLFTQLSGRFPMVTSGGPRSAVKRGDKDADQYTRAWQEPFTNEESTTQEAMDIAADIQFLTERSLVEATQKLFEETKTGSAVEVFNYFSAKEIKGEIVLVIHGR